MFCNWQRGKAELRRRGLLVNQILLMVFYTVEMKFGLNEKFSIFALSMTILLLVSTLGANVASSQNQDISGCVHKKTGALRLDEECLKSERKIRWNAYGIQGLEGAPGPVGEPGPQGKPGSTVLSGKGAPSAFMGEEGDFYIDLNSYKMYGPKKEDSWIAEVDLVGPAGPQGQTGPTGPSGASGPVGATGPSGIPGYSHLYFDFANIGLAHSGAAPELCYTSDFRLSRGDYAVIAYVEAFDDAEIDGGQTQVNAQIGIGEEISESIRGTTVPEFGNGSVTILWAFKSVSENSPVDIYCDSSGGVEFGYVSLVAIKSNAIN